MTMKVYAPDTLLIFINQKRKKSWITLPMVRRKMDGYRPTGKGVAPGAAIAVKVPMHLPVRCSIKDGWT